LLSAAAIGCTACSTLAVVVEKDGMPDFVDGTQRYVGDPAIAWLNTHDSPNFPNRLLPAEPDITSRIFVAKVEDGRARAEAAKRRGLFALQSLTLAGLTVSVARNDATRGDTAQARQAVPAFSEQETTGEKDGRREFRSQTWSQGRRRTVFSVEDENVLASVAAADLNDVDEVHFIVDTTSVPIVDLGMCATCGPWTRSEESGETTWSNPAIPAEFSGETLRVNSGAKVEFSLEPAPTNSETCEALLFDAKVADEILPATKVILKEQWPSIRARGTEIPARASDGRVELTFPRISGESRLVFLTRGSHKFLFGFVSRHVVELGHRAVAVAAGSSPDRGVSVPPEDILASTSFPIVEIALEIRGPSYVSTLKIDGAGNAAYEGTSSGVVYYAGRRLERGQGVHESASIPLREMKEITQALQRNKFFSLQSDPSSQVRDAARYAVSVTARDSAGTEAKNVVTGYQGYCPEELQRIVDVISAAWIATGEQFIFDPGT
jgi:hypothetical protein